MLSSKWLAVTLTRVSVRGANDTSAAAVELTKSWSTGVRKKSEYSVVPPERQYQSDRSAAPTAVRS